MFVEVVVSFVVRMTMTKVRSKSRADGSRNEHRQHPKCVRDSQLMISNGSRARAHTIRRSAGGVSRPRQAGLGVRRRDDPTVGVGGWVVGPHCLRARRVYRIAGRERLGGDTSRSQARVARAAHDALPYVMGAGRSA